MDGNRGGNRWCGSGPSLFFLNGARRGSVAQSFFSRKCNRRIVDFFSGTGC